MFAKRSPRSPLRRVLGKAAVAAAVAIASVALFLPTSGLATNVSLRSGLADLDARAGSLGASAGQQAIVERLGASATWNQYGTPKSLVNFDGWLSGTLEGAPATAAKSWIRANRSLFRLSDQGVDNLELLNDAPLVGSSGHAVLFRQRFGGLPAAQDGLLSLGISEGRVAYVSSSIVGDGTAGTASLSASAAKLSPTQAWARAAASVGASPVSISNVRKEHGWTVFQASGFAQPQRARLVALPTAKDGVRPAYEANVVNVQGAEATAYIVFVDAQTGKVLLRQNRVDHQAAAPQTYVFTGTYSNTQCGEYEGPYTAPEGTESIDVVASADFPTDDIVLQLHYGKDNEVAHGDVLFSPEAIHYTGTGGIVQAGDYYVRVCPYEQGQFQAGNSYAGNITINTVASTEFFQYPPKWKYFTSNPRLANPPTNLPEADIRIVGCWDREINGTPVPGCQRAERTGRASPAPWDHLVRENTPSYTTLGNNANTSEAWGSPLTPLEQHRPVDPQRKYIYPWKNTWNNHCFDVEAVQPQNNFNDIHAAVVNLFVGHNRMHDWSYYLGFTEENYNAQMNNFGETSPTRENDPEIGNAQAGLLTGRPPIFLGRDNANQITLQDGVPPISNMYVWQPVPAGFYGPCVDGDFDMSIIAHEYGHLIQNRMVAGPDAGLSGHQARAMGESWSDLTAVEYLYEFGYNPGAGVNRYAVGPYATGAFQKGIRNYAMNNSPLNYSDLEYDPAGTGSPHADGEIWSATNFDIRQAFVAKYGGGTPGTSVQVACAEGRLPLGQCPGNRKWAQLFHNAFLLMSSGSVTMVDARDAYLAADRMTFGGANQTLLWRAFARRGLGQYAASPGGPENRDPRPSFESPKEGEKAITFQARAVDENGQAVKAEIFVGDYEARAVPIADTDPATGLGATARFVPGTYRFIARANGYGHYQFARAITSTGSDTVTIHFSTNWASKYKGGTATGKGEGHVNLDELIDDTEETNWRRQDTSDGNADGTIVTVQLGGGAHVVRRVRVSAMIRPNRDQDENDPSQSRFTALRSFEIYACNQNLKNCANDGSYTKISGSGTSFPGERPRPLAPDMILRGFDVTDTVATHIRLKVLHNQCTQPGTPYQGDQDDDPTNNTDCDSGSSQDSRVRAAELQVTGLDGGGGGGTGAPQDPVVALTKTGPLTAARGRNVTFNISYKNAGPATASSAKIIDSLPAGLTFVSATNGGTYSSTGRKITWNLGNVANGASGTVSFTAKVASTVAVGSILLNQAEFIAPKTVSTPAAWALLVT